MYSGEIQVRVRYAETDQMGYVYYANYAIYFEVARVEMLRQLGFTYKKLEADGIMLPVLHYSIKYFKPAFYDDLLIIKTNIMQLPQARIHFVYETWNDKDEQINAAETTLVFVSKISNKPCAAPADLRKALSKYF